MSKQNKKYSAFTIVELLIVIVIIGILAAITIVSYTGITKKANESSIQADLANAKKQIELYKVIHGQYPTGLDPNNCLTGNISPSPDTNYCLKKSNRTATYTMSNADGTIYTLKLDNGTLAYKITESTGPTSTTTTPIAESFVKTWGGSGVDLGYGLSQSSDGGFAVTGYTTSYGAGSNDMFLAKYDSNGNLSWNRTWGGANTDAGFSLAQTSDGGFVVTGYTASYGAGSNDMFLVKYDANGNFSWNKLWGGVGSDVGQSVARTSDGGCVVTGYTTSYSAGSNDMFLAKYDSNGNLSWNRTWGGASSEIGQSLIQASDGGYAIAGDVYSFGAGSDDAFLVKYDASGNIVWNKTWGGAGTDAGISVIQSSDGGYAISGYTSGYGAGSDDVLLVKYDSSGNFSWNKVWGGTGSDVSQGAVQAGDGGYLIAGYTPSYGAGGNDAFILKTNSSGSINGCTSPMCQTPTATITTPSATVTSPTATVTTPSATITTPSATITTPAATQTTVVAAP